MNSTPHRFITLDGMRGFAAFAVMILHLTMHTSHVVLPGSVIAVDLFFCLSGFVISYTYLDRLNHSMTFSRFLLRRFIRLYPMFLFGLILGSGALITKIFIGHTNLGYTEAAWAILANSVYLPFASDFYVEVGLGKNVDPLFPINGPSWSLFFELVVNIIFAAAAIRSRYLLHLFLFFIGMFTLFLWIKMTWTGAPGWGAENFLGGFPRATYGFFSGVVAFIVFQRFKSLIPVVRPVFLMAFLFALFFKEWPSYIWLAQTIIVVPTLVLLGSVSISASTIGKTLSEYLGWISYSLYCLHSPVYHFYTAATDNQDYGLVGLIICAPVTMFLAHYSTKYLEEPLRKKLSKRLSHSPPAAD